MSKSLPQKSRDDHGPKSRDRRHIAGRSDARKQRSGRLDDMFGADAARDKGATGIVKIANAEDETTGRAYELYAFAKPCNREGTARIELEDACDANKVLNALRAQNAVLPKGTDAAAKVVKAAIDAEPQEYRLHAARSGWQEHAYVLGDRVIQIAPTALRTFPPMWTAGITFAENKVAGTVATWNVKVAKLAGASTAMITMISAGLTAPLLRLVERPSFLINVFGDSKIGKSTALVAAASTIGIGSEMDLPNWNATPAGLLQLARLFCDSILPMNELGAMKAKKGELRTRIAEITYAFAEGRDTLRHSGSKYATERGSAKFYGILVSTAEQSLHGQSIGSGGRAEGEVARAHDVPAVPEGATSIFDLDATISSEDAKLRLVEIRKACEANHGAAIEAHVRHIAKIPRDKLRERVNETVTAFVETLDLPATDLPLAHAAENFGLLLVGGMIAIESGVVPWSEKRLRRAIRTAFNGFRKATQRGDDTPEKARKTFRKTVKSLELEFVKKPSTLEEMPRAGFRTKRDGKMFYVVSSKAFSDWFSTAREARAALMWMKDRNWLRVAGRKAASVDNKDWAETTVKIADGKNVRVIQFLKPAFMKKTK